MTAKEYAEKALENIAEVEPECNGVAFVTVIITKDELARKIEDAFLMGYLQHIHDRESEVSK